MLVFWESVWCTCSLCCLVFFELRVELILSMKDADVTHLMQTKKIRRKIQWAAGCVSDCAQCIGGFSIHPLHACILRFMHVPFVGKIQLSSLGLSQTNSYGRKTFYRAEELWHCVSDYAVQMFQSLMLVFLEMFGASSCDFELRNKNHVLRKLNKVISSSSDCTAEIRPLLSSNGDVPSGFQKMNIATFSKLDGEVMIRLLVLNDDWLPFFEDKTLDSLLQAYELEIDGSGKEKRLRLACFWESMFHVLFLRLIL